MELDPLLEQFKAETADRSRAGSVDLDSHKHNVPVERAQEKFIKFVTDVTTVKINQRISYISKSVSFANVAQNVKLEEDWDIVAGEDFNELWFDLAQLH